MVSLASGLVPPPAPGGRPARWAATGRSGGVSRVPYDSLNLAGYVGDDPEAVAANRRLLAVDLGARAADLCVMDSVHGADLAVVDGGGVVPGVDALLTTTAGVVVVALGADCVPVALIGDDGRTVAAVHCGWRGLVADVVAVAVEAMRDHGANVRAAILGPAVCGQCYPVPPERAAEVRAARSAAVAASALVTTADGQPGIDVRAGLEARLRELAVDARSISRVLGCTVEDAGLFSYRRDGVTGRQGIAVCTSSGTVDPG
jgi:polyphenol oxidase